MLIILVSFGIVEAIIRFDSLFGMLALVLLLSIVLLLILLFCELGFMGLIFWFCRFWSIFSLCSGKLGAFCLFSGISNINRCAFSVISEVREESYEGVELMERGNIALIWYGCGDL